MPSYPNPSAAIDSHYVDAREQFEHLVGTLKHPDAQRLYSHPFCHPDRRSSSARSTGTHIEIYIRRT
jgi:hypothetical protein